MISDAGNWVSDPRGNPSRWVALALAVFFGLAVVAAALSGQGAHVTAVLGGLFVVTFNVAFGRRAVVTQIALAVARRPRGSPRRPAAD